MKVAAHVKKYLEGELVNYPLNKKDLAQAQQQLYLQHSSNGYVDLLERQADRVGVDKKMRPVGGRNIVLLENSVRAVEDVLAELPLGYRRLIELKYLKKRSNQFIADELNISLRTFYYWRDKALVSLAIRYGFI